MRIVGLMRVRNEGRWLERCLASQDFCEKIILLDDNSTDDTRDICAKFPNVEYHRKKYDAGYEEGPDREWLAEQAIKFEPDWICSLDGDEVLLPHNYYAHIKSAHKYVPIFDVHPAQYCNVQSLHLWNDEQTVRIDGHFKENYRQRFWRFPKGKLTYAKEHCSLPNEIPGGNFYDFGAKLLHYGNLTAADRLRRYKTYGSQYPVMIQGDPSGPDVSEVLSGEPFRLAPLCTML